MPGLIRRWGGPGILTPAGALAWGLAVLVQVVWSADVLAVAFVGAGITLFSICAFQARMRGPTKVGKDGIETNLAPDVSVRGSAPPALPPPEEADSATLLARWPTLEAALQSLPLGWTKDRIRHDDGLDYIHVKSPQGGFDVVINVAACDSPAPRWLMAAISVMENE